MKAEQGKRRGFGLSMCTALVVGNMIGSGVFLLPASLAVYGTISPSLPHELRIAVVCVA